MQFTIGEIASSEKIRNVADKPRLQWLGYEFVYENVIDDEMQWTWQRPEMEEESWFILLNDLCRRRQWRAVERLLKSAAAEPGFYGIRDLN